MQSDGTTIDPENLVDAPQSFDYFDEKSHGAYKNQTTPMTIKNIAFHADRTGREAGYVKFIRELIMNALQAGADTIRISPDWNGVEAHNVYRIMFSDNGCGMDEEEIKKFVNVLGSTGHQLKIAGGENYGIGGKITTLFWNHQGMMIYSWKNGHGIGAKLWFDPEEGNGEYGLFRFRDDEGNYSEFVEAPENYKPDFIKDHGTIIILCGNSEMDDTWLGPKIPGPGNHHALEGMYSILRTINSRFFRLPKNATLNVLSMKKDKADWPKTKFEAYLHRGDENRKSWPRDAHGMEYQLLQDSVEHGVIEDHKAKIHWYWLKPARGNHPYHLQGGFVASLYHDEIYDLHTGSTAIRYMSYFGITRRSISKNLVLIVEPSPENLMTDSARSKLIDATIYNQETTERLPWENFGLIWKDNIPSTIKEEMEKISNEFDDKEFQKSLLERFKEYAPLMSRNYVVPSLKGGVKFEAGTTEDLIDPYKPEKSGKPGKKNQHKPKLLPKVANLGNGEAGNLKNLHPELPKVIWVKEADDEVLQGRAARMDLPNYTLAMNEDFPLWGIETGRRFPMYDLSHRDDGEGIISKNVKDVYAEGLAFRIADMHKVKDTEHWTSAQWESALSPESLTFAVMGFKWANAEINQRISQLLSRMD